MNEPKLALDRIHVDPSLQPRVTGLDPEHVRTLESAAETWPPLVVVRQGGKLVLVDGFHRLAAAQNLGLADVPVEEVALPADSDLHALAFSLNARHGRPLSLADRRTFAERLLRQHPDWADREIGRRCGLSSNTVGGLREHLESAAQIEQPTARVGAGGYVYTVGTNPKQRHAGELPDAGLGEQVGNLVGRVFTSAERVNQRRIVGYLQRLAVALSDGEDFEGWQDSDDAAEACRLVLGQERAAALAERLGPMSRSVLDAAMALGYQDEED
jgi:ParB-like nuclease domain